MWKNILTVNNTFNGKFIDKNSIQYINFLGPAIAMFYLSFTALHLAICVIGHYVAAGNLTQ